MTKPITILIGDDPYLLNRELTRLQKKYLEPATKDFNFDRFSAESTPPQRIIDALNLLPMMAASRLVIVHDADKIKKEDAEAWIAYFEKPSPTTQLVLVGQKIDKRLGLWKTAQKGGAMVELKSPYPNQLPSWILGEARLMGLKISSEAAYALGEALGPNPMALAAALEKLEIYISPRAEIGLSDVEAVGGVLLSKTVFDFTEKVGAKNLKEAMGILDGLVEQGEPLVRLVFMIVRHFRLLLLAHEGLSNRLSETDLASRLGVHPFFVKDYSRQARQMTFEALRKTYRRLLACDRALKRSPLEPRHVVDRFLMQVCVSKWDG
ncbi:MAG: DNA polymerase III subunit delta [Deltaproteobacteria bacterium]|nr:DNA polymerase III subunit delta [Deltaproteobacteria bacterium]